MRAAFVLITFILPVLAHAKAPECPLFPGKKECLSSVERNYNDFINFIEEQSPEQKEDVLLMAASDIRYYESLACEKTCLN